MNGYLIAIYMGALAYLSFYDWKYMGIPKTQTNIIVVLFSLIGILYNPDILMSAIALTLVLFVTKKMVNLGDSLMFFPQVLVFGGLYGILSILIGSAINLLQKVKTKEKRVAFLPSMFLGTILTVLIWQMKIL